MAVEFSNLIPEPVLTRLSPHIQSAENIQSILNDWSEDTPHGRAHVVEMLFNLKWAWEELSVDESWTTWTTDYDLALRTIRLHDKGYAFVEQGILKPEEHQFGSLAIASVLDNDPRILYAILHHTDDILPQDAPRFCRVVRDLDRLSALGYTGINRMAYYIEGFKTKFEPLLQGDEEQLVNSGIFCESEYPKVDEYEKSARRFFKKELLKFVGEDISGNRADVMMELLQSAMVRTFGSSEYEVDPILDDLRWVFRPKIQHTLQAQMDLVGGWNLKDAPS